jgi:MFS family permease
MSITEGSLTTIFQYLTIGDNCTGPFIIGLALFLGTNDFQIGLLGALPFALQFLQIVGAIIIQRIGGRRLFVGITSLLARSVFFVLGIIPLIPFLSLGQKVLILFYVILFYNINAVMSGNAWTSWVGDLFPEKIRGTYFGIRNGIFSVIRIIAVFGAGLLLDYFIKSNHQSLGYSVIMTIGATAGTLGALFFFKHPERVGNISESINIIKLTLTPLKNKYFVKILMFFFFWNISIGICAPFFSVHMIRNLHMSFSQIALFQILGAVFAFLTSKIWGGFIDKFGSKSVLLASAALICLIPLIWLFPTKEFIWPVFLDPFLSGVCWTGFNLAAFTFPIDASPKDSRGFYIAMFGIFVGFGYLISSVIGGFLAQQFSDFHLMLFGMNFMNLHLLFFISFLLRVFSTTILRKLKEPEEKGAALIFEFFNIAFVRISLFSGQILPVFINSIPKQIVKSVENISPKVSVVALKLSDGITDKVDEISGDITTKVENISGGITNIVINITKDIISKIDNISDNVTGLFIDLAGKQKNKTNFKIKKKDKDDERTNS